jgi:hypothetical protein
LFGAVERAVFKPRKENIMPLEEKPANPVPTAYVPLGIPISATDLDMVSEVLVQTVERLGILR